MALKLAFINNKGGSSKTTSAVNIAGAYARKNPDKKVLIVESDGQGNATRSFNLKADSYDKTMYDVFMGNENAEDCIINAYQNIDLIPANNDMNFVEFDEMKRYEDVVNEKMYSLIKSLDGYELSDLKFEDFKKILSSKGENLTDNYFNMLKGKLDKIDKMYDLIIFDTPPEIKAVTSSVLAIADEVIIPFEPDLYSVDGIRNILSRITSIKKQLNKDLHIAGVLAAKVKRQTKLHLDIINSMMKWCNKNSIYYFDTEIPNSIRFASATSYNGLPATLVLEDNTFVKSYYYLLDELEEMNII